MQSEKLIHPLGEQVRKLITQAEALRQLDMDALTWREQDTSWNILECLEHLNLYGDFYLPQMANKIKSSTTKPDIDFSSGWLGNYFAKSMLPKAKLNKMRTFKDKNPLGTNLDKSVIDRFNGQQTQLLNLLEQSRTVSLNKIRIPTSISNLLRFKLGDTFRFYVNHMIRHFSQIEKIRAAMNEAGQPIEKVSSASKRQGGAGGPQFRIERV